MKKIVMMIVILLTTFLANAQVQLSQEQFKKVVDNMTCVCINEALGNSAVDCEKTTIQENDIPKTDTKTLDLYKEFQKLKTSNNNKEFSVIFLTNDVFNSSKYEKIKAFAKKREGVEIKNIIQKINDKITSITSGNYAISNNDSQTSDPSGQLHNSNPPSQVEQETASVYTENINTETKTANHSIRNFMTDYGFSFILFILIAAHFIYLKQRNFATKKQLESMLKDNEAKRVSSTTPYSPISSNKQNIVSEDSLNILKSKIRDLEDKIKGLEIQSKNDAPNPVIAITEVPKTPIVQQDDKIFYKHAPHESGYFDTEDDVSLGDAVFKFTIYNNNPNLASFEIIKEKKKLILDYPNKYIKPVCEELNALNQSANSLVITSGIVEKRSNQWIVKTKAKIKYE